jgi:periplasmic protein CpxP/Spy
MRKLLLAATAVVALAGASIVQAQTAPTDAPKAEHRMEMRREGMMGPMHHDPAKMADHLRTVLQLRPDQEPALKAFIASMPTPPKREDMEKMHESMKGKSTPDRAEAHIAMMREHLARMEKTVGALKTFYAALTPAQQKAFDAMHERHGHMMGGHMMGGHGMGHDQGGMMGDMPPPPMQH